jgi:hypothetical protein
VGLSPELPRDLAGIRHRNTTSPWHDASQKVNACARIAARKPACAAVPGYFPVLRENSRFGYSWDLKQLFDMVCSFEINGDESNNLPVIFPVHGNLLLTWMR